MIIDGLKKLKELRSQGEGLSADWSKRLEAFKKDNEYLLLQIEVTKNGIEEVTRTVREEALVLYDRDKDKDVGFGVKIRLMKKWEYEERVAFEWAKEHQLALKLDVKAFEKIAKADKMEFVEYKEVPVATIPAEIKC